MDQELVLLAAAVILVLIVAFYALRPRQPPPFLEPDTWKQLPLVDKKELTHNTRRFRFALPHPRQALGLPVGQHIILKAAAADGSNILKPYTPVSDDDLRGYMDFVIKVYPEGRMSRHLDSLALGDTMLFKGPKGRFNYAPNMKQRIGMIAGGTGITPMYQVAAAILKNPADRTEVSLIFGNVTVDDVLILAELDALEAAHPGRFKVYHVLNQPPPGWAGGVGFVSAEHISAHLPPPGLGVLIARCGPPPMNKAMAAHLDALGYAKDMQFEF
ncbi:hypothetical protein WJX81_006728 [Elliptochloris bilobata]|uniref:NADH-cytochrome b5 reductase n=1 Tax=Elliptochloris bilobata TaxID=381761 RepID=A0AAW1RNH1_9CHLO